MSLTWKLTRFNPRRAFRGAPAAECECREGEYVDRLWMTPRDIKRNLADSRPGDDVSGLQLAAEHYRTRIEYPPEAAAAIEALRADRQAGVTP